jgi:hypothetical protein
MLGHNYAFHRQTVLLSSFINIPWRVRSNQLNSAKQRNNPIHRDRRLRLYIGPPAVLRQRDDARPVVRICDNRQPLLLERCNERETRCVTH